MVRVWRGLWFKFELQTEIMQLYVTYMQIYIFLTFNAFESKPEVKVIACSHFFFEASGDIIMIRKWNLFHGRQLGYIYIIFELEKPHDQIIFRFTNWNL